MLDIAEINKGLLKSFIEFKKCELKQAHKDIKELQALIKELESIIRINTEYLEQISDNEK